MAKKEKKEKGKKAKHTVGIEREIRRHIKPRGGYRKELSAARKKIVDGLLKKVGRTARDGWDLEMHVPGLTKYKM